MSKVITSTISILFLSMVLSACIMPPADHGPRMARDTTIHHTNTNPVSTPGAHGGGGGGHSH